MADIDSFDHNFYALTKINYIIPCSSLIAWHDLNKHTQSVKLHDISSTI